MRALFSPPSLPMMWGLASFRSSSFTTSSRRKNRGTQRPPFKGTTKGKTGCIYIYIYMCVCVCVRVCIDIVCLYIYAVVLYTYIEILYHIILCCGMLMLCYIILLSHYVCSKMDSLLGGNPGLGWFSMFLCRGVKGEGGGG